MENEVFPRVYVSEACSWPSIMVQHTHRRGRLSPTCTTRRQVLNLLVHQQRSTIANVQRVESPGSPSP
eukprot:scaffold3100_cov248-Pinguiococcus_pyrenoidosus.AAC.7